MAERVDHASRKREIALKATHLFSQVGYDSVSLIRIAEEAGVARTILYRYFKDKREVFDAAIRANTGQLLDDCLALAESAGTTTPERLRAICGLVAEALFLRREFLAAVYDFVLAMIRQGEDMRGRIAEFTKGTRALLRELVARGVADGSFAPETDPEQAASMLFGLLELCTSRIVLGVEQDACAAKARFADYIERLTSRS